ncbi:YkvA family protein [Aquibium oceanicum]|uniref:DUF1232 domain-containing protein n=1 Tax=Aquibium oceanicum TaxID=1670800 RepID=A0A1L3SVV6_9HYPH|nr:DUF1232 domain-containing protein [Aquibium oceanicum]APH73518.1 hypothetical protein BSQ44_20700 [Aquibium oceanicum]
MTGAFSRLKDRAREIERDVVALWFAARDSRTPVAAKLVAATAAAYALSPIDLVPDFIPIIGYLDDLILLPLGIALAVRLIPDALMAEFRRDAVQQLQRPRSAAGAAIVIVVWIAVAVLLAWLFWPDQGAGR